MTQQTWLRWLPHLLPHYSNHMSPEHDPICPDIEPDSPLVDIANESKEYCKRVESHVRELESENRVLRTELAAIQSVSVAIQNLIARMQSIYLRIISAQYDNSIHCTLQRCKTPIPYVKFDINSVLITILTVPRRTSQMSSRSILIGTKISSLHPGNVVGLTTVPNFRWGIWNDVLRWGSWHIELAETERYDNQDFPIHRGVYGPWDSRWLVRQQAWLTFIYVFVFCVFDSWSLVQE